MKQLPLAQDKALWLIEAVDGRPAKTTAGARTKGELLIALADLLDTPEPKQETEQ